MKLIRIIIQHLDLLEVMKLFLLIFLIGELDCGLKIRYYYTQDEQGSTIFITVKIRVLEMNIIMMHLVVFLIIKKMFIIG